MSNWTMKKRIWVLLGIIVVAIGVIVTIFLVQKQQETRSRAEKSTTLTLTPPNQNISGGEDAKLDLTINPGINQVNFVRITIKFDPARFNPALTVFNTDPDSPLKPQGNTSFTEDGEVTFTLNVGNDPTKVIQTTTRLGRILLPSVKDATAGSSLVVFDMTKTQVRSLGAKDAFTENVLSSTVPATVTIGGPICRPTVSTCSWDASEGVTSYHYTVAVEDSSAATGNTPILDGDTPETSIEFPSEPGKTYQCFVKASNECGESSPASGLSTCPLPSETPTPTLTPIPSESPTPTLTPVPTETPIPTETPMPTETPTPTLTPTLTPIPTVAEVIPTDQFAQDLTATPLPTLMPTGNPLVYGGIIGGILFVLGGLALLLL